MPELPEVETIVRGLSALGLRGKMIGKAAVFNKKTIAAPDWKVFCRRIRGKRILDIGRFGKYIIIRCSEGYSLLIHLRMTGKLTVEKGGRQAGPYDRAVLYLEGNKELRFKDVRRFGRWHLVKDPATVLGKLGPDPLGSAFDEASFLRMLKGRRGRLKTLLLDQSFLAGIGNIYADEVLWLSRLHPLKRAHTLKNVERRRLHKAICRVLKSAIANMGTSLGETELNYTTLSGRKGNNQNALTVYRRTGFPCPRCGMTIRRLVVSQRSTHFCPRCQRHPQARKI